MDLFWYLEKSFTFNPVAEVVGYVIVKPEHAIGVNPSV